MTAVFRPEAVLTLFLRMRTKGIAKSLGKCIPIKDLYCPWAFGVVGANGSVRFLIGSF